eukprot:346312-Pleurochrysis_carterae.AAC.2
MQQHLHAVQQLATAKNRDARVPYGTTIGKRVHTMGSTLNARGGCLLYSSAATAGILSIGQNYARATRQGARELVWAS